MRTTWEPGLIADIVDKSYRERLLKFIVDEESEPLALFSAEHKSFATAGDWYGEHAGKWLVAASSAYLRTQDPEVALRVKRVVGFLAEAQEPSGYLGTYATESASRFTHESASEVRTWDLWVHAWMILGLLRAAEIESQGREIAVRIGDLLVDTFESGRSVIEQGNHQGLSSTILLEPLALLSAATGDRRYTVLALKILEEAEAKGLGLLEPSRDVAEIGTGKAYQILWTLQGMLALFRLTDDPRLVQAVRAHHDNVEAHHLTPLGGPWGGIAGHKEVFNAKGFFHPEGIVETCSTATWLSLSYELFRLTGDGRYAEAFENAFLNSLVGAADENGSDWCYFTFPNGRRNNTYHWACCKSSGALALENASAMAATANDHGVSINLFLPARHEFERDGKSVIFRQSVAWADGEVTGSIAFESSEPCEMTLSLRQPMWGEALAISVEGVAVAAELDDRGFWNLKRNWNPGDTLEWRAKTSIRVHPYTQTIEHHGQEIVRKDFAYVSCGPWVYAASLFDGFRKEETLRLPKLLPDSVLRFGPKSCQFGPSLELRLPGRASISLLPYAEAGGRHDAAWRTTWLQVAWQ